MSIQIGTKIAKNIITGPIHGARLSVNATIAMVRKAIAPDTEAILSARFCCT